MTDEAASGRRSAFLAFMAVIANLYLLGFAADAAFSVADEIIRSEALSRVRLALAVLVVLASFPMLVIILFVPHLPKLVFLPLLAFVIWAGFGAPPFTDFGDDGSPSLAIASVQLFLAVAAFLVNRVRTGKALLAAARLPRLGHLGLRTALALVILLALFPITIAGLAVAGTALYLESQTKGFVDFTDSEIRLTERIYQKGTRRVVLIGMMHFGESGFYDSLFEEFPADALVLAEGVSDRDNRLSNNLSYQRLAHVLGLEQQPVLIPTLETDDFEVGFDAPNDEENAAKGGSAGEAPKDIRIAKLRPDVVYADADLADFSDTTIEFLNETAALYDSRSGREVFERLTQLSEFSEDDIDTVYDDIIYKRNAGLLAEVDKSLKVYDTIIIPWGALHMPDLETNLIDREFVQASERSIPLIRYETILDSLRGRI